MDRMMRDLKGYSEFLVKELGLKGLSLQACGWFNGEQVMMKFLDYMLPSEASDMYFHNKIYKMDPFTDITLNEKMCGTLGENIFMPSDDVVISSKIDRAEFWHFISGYGLTVEGVSTRCLSKGIYTAVGFLREDGRNYKTDITKECVNEFSYYLHNMMAVDVLGKFLNTNSGRIGFSRIISGNQSSDNNEIFTRLSSRELQIANLVSGGKQNKEIAYFLGISEQTVGNHLRRVYSKLGIHNRASLVRVLSSVLN